MARKADEILAEFQKVFAEKNKQYGNQTVLLREVMDKITYRLETPDIPAELSGMYHFTMELLTKFLRFYNIMYGKSNPNVNRLEDSKDSLKDMSVYAAMIYSMIEEMQEDEERHSSP